MYEVVREDSPKFQDIHKKVCNSKQRINFRSIASKLKDLLMDCNSEGYIVIEYSHDQISNVVNALKKHGLEKGVDFKLTRNMAKPTEDSNKKTEQIIITPIKK